MTWEASSRYRFSPQAHPLAESCAWYNEHMLRSALAHIKKRSARGFTLVELLVVMTLILIITTYSIAGYFPFMTKIEYENVVMDIALNIREHQIYGIGTKQASSNVFAYGYGLHAAVDDPADPDDSKMIFFQDNTPDNAPVGTPDNTDGDGLYLNGLNCATPECLKLISMNGYTVSGIGLLAGSTWSTLLSDNYVDVTFKRPYLDAKIYANGNTGIQYDQVNLCIRDDAQVVDRRLKIQIFRTGQISVTQTNDPTSCQGT